MDPVFRWALAGVMLLGSPFAAIGAYEGVRTSQELTRSVRTTGTVVENRLTVDRRDGVEEHAYQPVVEFHDGSGQRRRFTDPVASLPPDYATGTALEIAFDPRDPTQARIVSWKRLWLVPTLLLAVGALPALVCLLVLRRTSRSAAVLGGPGGRSQRA